MEVFSWTQRLAVVGWSRGSESPDRGPGVLGERVSLDVDAGQCSVQRRGRQAATAEQQMTTGAIVIRTRNASKRTPKERAKRSRRI
jgi:hypothetical protein